jgi:hypothetical protein
LSKELFNTTFGKEKVGEMAKILIVSENVDFGKALCQLASEQLMVTCEHATCTQKDAEYDAVIQTKKAPIRLRDFLEEIQAHLKKPNDYIEIGRGIVLSRRSKMLLRMEDNAKEDMTDKELSLIGCLLTGGVISREELLKKVWGMSNEIDTHTLETHIYRLRNKLKTLVDAPWIVVDSGGYRLEL